MILQGAVLAADCTTIANNTWDCGTPSGADNLIVNHTVTISSAFNLTGTITINNGGLLTITGTLTTTGGVIIVNAGGTVVVAGSLALDANSDLQIYGDVEIQTNLDVINSSISIFNGGSFTIDGYAQIDNQSSLLIESGGLAIFSNNFANESNDVIINGTIDITGNFGNPGSISGTGIINYGGNCGGVGTVNGVTSGDYCGGGLIEMANLSCSPDNTNPVIMSVPVDTTIYAPSGSCSTSFTWSLPVAYDNCNLQSYISSHNSGDAFSVGATVVTYTATDASSNITNASFTITVLDTISPSISGMPSNISQNADASGCGAAVTWTLPTATDNCGISSLTGSHNSGDFFPVGTTTVSYTALDVNGNSVVSSFDIIITDNINPAISGMPSNISQNADAGACGAVVTWTLPTATDNCSISTLTGSHNSGDFFPVGTTTVSYTALDANGNSAISNFDITITDNINPVIAGMPADVSADVVACGANVNWTIPTASDNCSINSLTSSHNPGDLFPIGTTTVTYTATDVNGNSTAQSFNITLNDNINPTISSMPANIVQNADAGSCGAVVNWTLPTATDNCAINSLTSSHNSGDFFSLGTTTVTYTAVDVNGNSAVSSFDITITDNINPTISSMPSNIVQNADAGSCGAIVTWSLPTASDNCTISSMTSSHNSGDFFSLGTTTVTYTALDVNGNSTISSFDITITDNINPTISGIPSNINQNVDAGSCGATVTWSLPIASDNCGISSFTSSHNSGDFFPVGTTTVSFTALDVNGNSAVSSFDITITDNINPTISGMPSNIAQNADAGSCGAIVTWTSPTASDNCTISSMTSSHTSGDFFPVGTTTVTYTVLDVNGNSSVSSFDVIVNDNTSPIISNLPEDIYLDVDAGQCGATVTWKVPTVTDNCSVTLASSHNPGDFFAPGSTVVTYTATDISGNSSNSTFNVIITDNTPPNFTFCPVNFTIEATDMQAKKSIISWDVPIATDPCSSDVVLTSNYQPGDWFDFGTTEVIYTATDDSGNTATCSFEVYADGINPPSFDPQQLIARSGEPITIFLQPKDQGTGNLKIASISYSAEHATISEVDSAALSFVYKSFENYSGTDNLEINIINADYPQLSAIAKVIIEVEPNMNISVSSAITTNGDGINDEWIITNITEYPNNLVRIFDPWGSEIYRNAGYDNQDIVWSGKNSNGNYVPPGTYFYSIDLGLGRRNITGAIEVIR